MRAAAPEPRPHVRGLPSSPRLYIDLPRATLSSSASSPRSSRLSPPLIRVPEALLAAHHHHGRLWSPPKFRQHRAPPSLLTPPFNSLSSGETPHPLTSLPEQPQCQTHRWPNLPSATFNILLRPVLSSKRDSSSRVHHSVPFISVVGAPPKVDRATGTGAGAGVPLQKKTHP